ncbi:MAG: hypothetical protein KKA42_10170 [candidate division Zixibacteria bacterium]|nr:hypothetical protein [candidate division Zixibacteria bacterium]
MTESLVQILTEGATYQLAALIGAAVFFFVVACQEMKTAHFDAILYFTLSFFFLAAHFFALLNIPAMTRGITELNVWMWLVTFFAPALITLFIVRGLYSLLTAWPREGMVKLFFGLTLLLFIFVLGTNWATDVRGVFTIVWLFLFFKMEFGVLQR